jgi:lycopene elongase/hydratase (dihydrobisanhydrobacterioruberin-forming)
MKKVSLLFKVSRPLFWPIGPLVFLSGLFYSHGNLTSLAIIQALVLTFPGGIVAYGLNDIYDYKTDRINKRKNGFWGAILKPKYHKLVFNSAILSSFALFISSLITKNPLNIISMITLIVFLFMYSVNPIRLKERPPFDSISNGLIVLSTFLLGYSFGNPAFTLNPEIVLLSFCVCGVHAYTTLVDYIPDYKTKTKTFAIIYGKRAAALIPMIIFLFTIFSVQLKWPIVFFLSFCAVLFVISSVFPSEKLAGIFAKLIFCGFFIFSCLYLLVSLNYI